MPEILFLAFLTLVSWWPRCSHSEIWTFLEPLFWHLFVVCVGSTVATCSHTFPPKGWPRIRGRFSGC